MVVTEARRRIGFTFLDQVVSSGSNFALGVVIARLSGAAEFGDYVLTMMIWLVVVGVHRALITEPIIVVSHEVDDHRTLLRRGVNAELLVGALVSIVVAISGALAMAAGAHIGALVLSLAPWFPSLLLQDYWRAMAFQRQRPALALVNDLVFAGVQASAIAVFLALGWRSAEYVITAWGVGATAGALLGFAWSPAKERVIRGWHLLARLWPLSRWMLADFLAGFASYYAYLAFVALLISRYDYGGFRGALNLMGPVYVMVLAGGNLGLPEASRRRNRDDPHVLWRFARSLSFGMSACVGLYGIGLALTASWLLTEVYGAEFARFAPLAALAALQELIFVSVFGQGIVLKAAGRVRRLWVLQVLVAVASVVSMVVLVTWFGTIGAGWAGVATSSYYALGVYAVFRAETRRPLATEDSEFDIAARALSAAAPTLRGSEPLA